MIVVMKNGDKTQLYSTAHQNLLILILLSPEVLRSELVFVFEKPTPADDSRKRIFAYENQFEKKKAKLCFHHILSF